MTSGRTSPSTSAEQTRFWEKINLMAEISALCGIRQPDEHTYQAVLELIEPMVPFDAATLYLLDAERKHFQERANVNGRVDLLSFLKIGRGEGLAGFISAIQKPILLAERNESDQFNPKTDYATVLAVPLMNNAVVTGVISLGCRSPRALSDKHVRLMSVIADQLSISVERRQYERTITRQHEELEEAHQRLKSAQERLIAQEKLAGVAELATTVNHEINNPLAVIIGNAQCLLAENASMTQKSLSRLHRIEESAIRISEINRRLININQIVSESYLGSGERMLNLEKSTVK